MQWLNKVFDELVARHGDEEIVVSSGVSPSGPYHVGTLREVMTAEAISRELKRRGHKAKHIHVSDDLDVFRKVPINLPEEFSQHLGKPLCDVPAPEGEGNYADYFINDLFKEGEKLNLEMEVVRAHKKYREGYFAGAIQTALEKKEEIKKILESISGHKVDDNWSPVQVIEDGYLKNRPVIEFSTADKTVTFENRDNRPQTVSYADGNVKLNWRIDWPARWALMGVNAEPFGRDHATKGGSYDTGAVLVKDIYNGEAPYPLPYNFINRTGDTKKMSKSSGDVITVVQLLEVLPPEVVWFFMLRYSPDKQLFFDEGQTLIRLVDEFGELLAKSDKTEQDKQLLELCLYGIDTPTISRVPFSHLMNSYQAALKDADKTIQIIGLTEYSEIVKEDAEIIKAELKFIDRWLEKHAPEDVKFSLQDTVNIDDFDQTEKAFMSSLADKILEAPEDADGNWFHLAIYDHKESMGLQPKQMFTTLYKALIGKESGPRAGWFLSMLPRDWLIKRLKLEA